VRKIRLLEIVSGFGLGGAEKALAARMRYLPAMFEQTVLNVRPEIDAFQPDSEYKEIRVFRRGIRGLLQIRRFLKNHYFDVIIVRTPLDAIRFGFMKKFYGKNEFKLVFEAHSNFLTKRFGFQFVLGVFLRWNFRNIDLVIAVSDNVIRGPLCLGHRNVHKVYLGSKIDNLELGNNPTRSPHLLFVGRLVDLKRPVWLLERILNLSNKLSLSQPTLTIVGSGPLETTVRRFIQINNLEKVISYVGSVNNVSNYYASATHLVSCSTNEGLPLTFFEAKLAGLSILATPSGGGAEIFDAQDQELMSFDEAEFEDALIKILSAPSPTLAMRRSIQANSSWMSTEHCAKQYYALLTRLVSE
jgi:glycosyltransferase involved in cell wall biosynthesis